MALSLSYMPFLAGHAWLSVEHLDRGIEAPVSVNISLGFCLASVGWHSVLTLAVCYPENSTTAR